MEPGAGEDQADKDSVAGAGTAKGSGESPGKGAVPEEAKKTETAEIAPQPKMISPRRQEDLRKRGTAAIAEKDYRRAILVYTELLDAADPEVREVAQFELATAQEYEKHLAHARAEYRNYLNTYPKGK